MTLIEKLRAAHGDNAELCHMAASAIERFATYNCTGCVHSETCVGGKCVGWDYIDNNDSVQPHTKTDKYKQVLEYMKDWNF